MAQFDVFRNLSKSEMKSILDFGVIRPVDSGKLLFRKGDVGHEMYIVLKGKIQIIDEYDTHRKILAELGPGEIFGEMAMFERSTRSAHACAKENSQVLVLSEDVLKRLMEKKIPRQFLANVIEILCHRLRLTNVMYMRAKYGEGYPKEVKWLG
ncbi:MAG: hypothetical protein Kow0099_12900 [Candidatus Abyssubacteria bacterium]